MTEIKKQSSPAQVSLSLGRDPVTVARRKELWQRFKEIRHSKGQSVASHIWNSIEAEIEKETVNTEHNK